MYGTRTCLDGNGAKAYFNKCNGSNEYQKWDTANNKLKHLKSGKCISSNGSNITWADCADNNSQRWVLNESTNSYTHANSGKCLEHSNNTLTLNQCNPKNYFQSWFSLPSNTDLNLKPLSVAPNGFLSSWYYDSKKANTALQGPYTGCTKAGGDTKAWAPLPVYISGSGKENVHWKYTNDANDPDCVNNWTYYDKDGKTILGSNISNITNLKDSKNWCMLNKYISGGPKDLTWGYCDNTVKLIMLSFKNILTGNELSTQNNTVVGVSNVDSASLSNIWVYNVYKKTIMNLATSRYLYNPSNSNNVSLEKEYNSLEFKWEIDYNNGTIRSLSNNYCLENGGTASKDNVIKAYKDDNSNNKKWNISLKIRSYDINITNNAQTKMALEHGGTASTGNLVKAYKFDNTVNKQWVYNSDKTTICSKHDNLCLRNPKGSNDVDVKTLEDTDEYKWTLNLLNKSICSKSNNYCVENGGSASTGNTVKAYPYDNEKNKKWDIVM